jgi:hypothetical protein
MRRGWRNLAAVTMLVTAGYGLALGAPGVQAAQVAHAEPTLGLLTGLFAQGGVGFGQVEPREVYNGGDPTGLVTSITWHGWGQAQAVGAGRGTYVAPGQAVAAGKIEPVRIVAFDLGTCNGRYMYAAVEWYFPQHGQAFNGTQFEDVCIGAYYPPQTGPYVDGGASVLTLNGTPGSLTGSVAVTTTRGKAPQRLFSFHGRASIGGQLTLVSGGPFENGHTFTGTWGTLDVILSGCASYLRSAAYPHPSCTFYP